MTATARRLLLCAGVTGTLAFVPAAHAAGPPVPSSASGKAGAVAPGGTERIVTRRAGSGTAVLALRRSNGRVLRSRHIAGRWTIPAVTLDNATTGLSADGGTLVLARPTRRFPPRTTPLAFLDARELTVRREVVLPGFFTVDAISPDGSSVYLVQYPSEDFLNYRVRALDTRSGRLASRDIVDPRNPDEQMGGVPMARALSPDGRWAYTLYGGGGETFIHALDTVGRTAACIDLEMLPPDSDFTGMRLVVGRDGRQVAVRNPTGVVATVDARTFAVSEPGAAPERPAAPAPAQAPAPADDGGGFPWLAVLIGGVAAGVAGAALVLVRRRARPESTAVGS